MLSDEEAERLWRRLFRGQPVTSLTLTEAQSVLNELSPMSPLHERLSKELERVRASPRVDS